MDNKEKVLFIIIFSIAVILFGGLLGFGIYKSANTKVVETTTTSTRTTTTETTTKIVNDKKEVAIFNGGVGEITYRTHIYKIENGQDNMGFEYTNETCVTKSYGSSEWDCNETKSGEFTWTEEAFPIAKKNGAYSYVKVPGDSKIYTIEQFQKKFSLK